MAEIVVKIQWHMFKYIFSRDNLVKQGTVLSQILNNCSLDQVYKEDKGHQNGKLELKSRLKSSEFVYYIADLNDGPFEAQQNNKMIVSIQERK